jgi:hypothetical protein
MGPRGNLYPGSEPQNMKIPSSSAVPARPAPDLRFALQLDQVIDVESRACVGEHSSIGRSFDARPAQGTVTLRGGLRLSVVPFFASDRMNYPALKVNPLYGWDFTSFQLK